jgi:hypothetical protein
MVRQASIIQQRAALCGGVALVCQGLISAAGNGGGAGYAGDLSQYPGRWRS